MAKINTSHSKLACRKVHTEQTCRRKSNRGKETTHKKESETQSNAQWSKVKQWFVSEPYLWSSPLYLVHNPDFTLLIWGVLNSFEVTVKTTWLLPTYCSPLGAELTGLSTFLFVFSLQMPRGNINPIDLLCWWKLWIVKCEEQIWELGERWWKQANLCCFQGCH